MQNNPTEPMTWDVSLATRMRETGMTYAQIGAVFSLSPDTIHSRIDPEYRRKRQWQKSEKRQYLPSVPGVRASKVSNDELAARLAEIPDDTRDYTGRAFGDPVFGRSAAARTTAQPIAKKITLPRVSILSSSKQEGQSR